ncbi:MAG TPA: aldo/keto reductase [Bacteroidia bacterium]|nr:aldo/keto reductase [Bacteroidia bacterium]
MEYRRLGKSGLQVSVLSLGSWVTFGNQVNDKTAENLMKIAYDAGVNFFDNAETYADGKSEIVMGKILKKMSWERSSYIVSSKVFWGGKLPNQFGLSRKHVIEACNAALKRLHVEYLDLYFCHRPDKNTPIEETVRAMSHLVDQGKILYWGTSEWSAQQITEAYAIARQFNLVPPTMEQPQYNMFCRERFEVEYYRLYQNEIGLGTTIWSPLASGLLTGKYNTKVKEKTRVNLPGMEWLMEKTIGVDAKVKLDKVEKLIKLSKKLGITLPQLVLNWCMYQPNVSTIILGASKESQLKENLNSIHSYRLYNSDINESIEKVLNNKPVLPKF